MVGGACAVGQVLYGGQLSIRRTSGANHLGAPLEHLSRALIQHGGSHSRRSQPCWPRTRSGLAATPPSSLRLPNATGLHLSLAWSVSL